MALDDSDSDLEIVAEEIRKVLKPYEMTPYTRDTKELLRRVAQGIVDAYLSGITVHIEEGPTRELSRYEFNVTFLRGENDRD